MNKGRMEAFRDRVLATLIALHGRDSVLATALGRDLKGKVSIVLYLAAIPLAFVHPWISCALYVLVAVLWFVPDRRIEKTLKRRQVRRLPETISGDRIGNRRCFHGAIHHSSADSVDMLRVPCYCSFR